MEYENIFVNQSYGGSDVYTSFCRWGSGLTLMSLNTQRDTSTGINPTRDVRSSYKWMWHFQESDWGFLSFKSLQAGSRWSSMINMPLC